MEMKVNWILCRSRAELWCGIRAKCNGWRR